MSGMWRGHRFSIEDGGNAGGSRIVRNGAGRKMRRLLLIVVLGCVIPTPAFAAKCTINEDMVFVIDGKKVFPIGFTMPPPPEGKTPAGKNGIDELHDAGATLLRTGVMATNWDEATFELQQKWLDAAGGEYMDVRVNLREGARIDGPHPENEGVLREIL